MSNRLDAAMVQKGDYILLHPASDKQSLDIMYVEYVEWTENAMLDLHGTFLWENRQFVIYDVPASAEIEVLNA